MDLTLSGLQSISQWHVYSSLMTSVSFLFSRALTTNFFIITFLLRWGSELRAPGGQTCFRKKKKACSSARRAASADNSGEVVIGS